MSSLAFAFDLSPIVIFNDEEGGVRYWPALVDSDLSDAWFTALRNDIEWRSAQRPMYDRIVDVPRLQATLELSEQPSTSVLGQAMRLIQRECAAPFTRVGLNFYRDGADSVAMHNDRMQFLEPGAPIAILSLGAARDMLIRRKDKRDGAKRIRLEPESLLVMSHASQRTHEHGIPKTKAGVGPRISCAFRVRTPSCGIDAA